MSDKKPVKIKAKCPDCRRRLWRNENGETACLTHGYRRPKTHKTDKGTTTTAPRQRKNADHSNDEKRGKK